MSNTIWNAKLHARLHDPAEKALILMRTVEGHEGGTSRTLLHELLGKDATNATKDAVRLADRWASAADRAAFPNADEERRWPAWQNVRFDQKPVLIHPLTGQQFDLAKLSNVEPDKVKQLSLAHFKALIQKNDLKATALAFWRFGPELKASDLGALWRMTPADTRVPDHTIWDHLDLTSALAGAFADGDAPALLAVSLGPVQSFIAAARSTSDLWAGSHLLSRLAWEAMRVICEELGPDAIIFPRLRGVPQVDVWLQQDCGLPKELFETCAWRQKGTDTNPLFAAALPNRFTAIVPASRAKALGEKITLAVQSWVIAQTERAFKKLLDAAGETDREDLPGYAQIREQLAGFPEVHWAAVPWSLAMAGEGLKIEASEEALANAMRPFFNAAKPGFLGSKSWEVMGGGVLLEQGWMWRPNPGALYPALHELLERVLAATKSTREFPQTEQTGWRCTLTGESEWLTTNRDQLSIPAGQRKDTLWTRVVTERKAWVKQGEHLGALATLKRLWPNLFVEELKDVVGDVSRFVVSTHTMALAGILGKLADDGRELPPAALEAITAASVRNAVPPRLARKLARHPQGDALARLPAWLEDEAEAGHGDQARSRLGKLFGHKPEAYYALILMDGDKMGAWLSASAGHTRPYCDSFHPQINSALESRFAGDEHFQAYAKSSRAPNPAWHMAISEALNNFSLTLAPAVVHDHFNGRVLYAGGDDLMAMLPLTDLLPAMAALRAVYAGIDPRLVGAQQDIDPAFRRQGNGFVQHGGQVLRVMGENATACIGVVIAHHQTPLNRVLRELRAAEKRAKEEGGRDAYSISLLKRSGGAQRLTSNWCRKQGDSPMICLRELAAAMTHADSSRRAAYLAREWSVDLPPPASVGGDDAWRTMLTSLLEAQFRRQKLDNAAVHARRLAELAPLSSTEKDGGRQKAIDHLDNFLAVAEFFAREGRGMENDHD